MTQADSVHNTPRRTASKIQTRKRVKKSDLSADAAELKMIDGAITQMHIEFGDDADSRKDYRTLAARRREILEIFGSTAALSQSDIEAKALALSQRATLEDYRITALVAKSLADDILSAAAKIIAIGDDRPAKTLPRAQQIVELLSTCYVRKGWKIDKSAATRALAYVRKYAEDGSDPDEGRKAAINFFASHGQSLDWVFCGDIGGMICGLAKHSERAAKVAGLR